MTFLHEEYYSHNDNLVLFRCTKCGYTSLSLGDLHGHIESHRGYTHFNIQIPFTKTSPANISELMKYTKVIEVTDTNEITLNEVKGL